MERVTQVKSKLSLDISELSAKVRFAKGALNSAR